MMRASVGLIDVGGGSSFASFVVVVLVGVVVLVLVVTVVAVLLISVVVSAVLSSRLTLLVGRPSSPPLSLESSS